MCKRIEITQCNAHTIAPALDNWLLKTVGRSIVIREWNMKKKIIPNLNYKRYIWILCVRAYLYANPSAPWQNDGTNNSAIFIGVANNTRRYAMTFTVFKCATSWSRMRSMWRDLQYIQLRSFTRLARDFRPLEFRVQSRSGFVSILNTIFSYWIQYNDAKP